MALLICSGRFVSLCTPHPTTSNLLMLEQREIGFSCSNNLGDNHTQASLVWWEGGLYVRYGFFLYVQI